MFFVLFRFVLAWGHKSGKQSAAREHATEQAAEFSRREAALEDLAVDHFLVIDGTDARHEQTV